MRFYATTCARRSAPAFAVVLLLASAASQAEASLPKATPGVNNVLPKVLEDVDITQKLGAQLPLDLEFVDDKGQAVHLGDYFGKRPVVLAMVYYECPMLCTLVLNGMTKALRILSLDAGQDFEVVAVSINPKETPAMAAAKKATYLENYSRPGAENGWHFLTGTQDNIAALAKTIGFGYRYIPEQDQYAHAAAITIITPGGKVALYLYGVQYPPTDLRLGLVEASAGTIGNPVDKLLLYCFHYDPVTGSYAAVSLAMVRVGGLITMLALGGFIVISRLRERRSEQGS